MTLTFICCVYEVKSMLWYFWSNGGCQQGFVHLEVIKCCDNWEFCTPLHLRVI